MLPQEDFKKIILNNGKLLSQLSDESCSIRKSEDKWSQKEVLGHLIDSANVNYNRFIMAISKNDLVFDSYPQDDWVQLQKYNKRDWLELMQLWKSINMHIDELVKSIPESAKNKLVLIHNFDKICWKVVGKNEKSSLSYLIKDYIGHLEHHMKQILNY